MIKYILPVLILAGCCTDPKIIYKDRIVEVPKIIMEECPKAPVVPPLLSTPLKTLNVESSNEDIAKAYVKTVEIQDIKLIQYGAALAVCRNE